MEQLALLDHRVQQVSEPQVLQVLQALTVLLDLQALKELLVLEPLDLLVHKEQQE